LGLSSSRLVVPSDVRHRHARPQALEQPRVRVPPAVVAWAGHRNRWEHRHGKQEIGLPVPPPVVACRGKVPRRVSDPACEPVSAPLPLGASRRLSVHLGASRRISAHLGASRCISPSAYERSPPSRMASIEPSSAACETGSAHATARREVHAAPGSPPPAAARPPYLPISPHISATCCSPATVALELVVCPRSATTPNRTAGEPAAYVMTVVVLGAAPLTAPHTAARQPASRRRGEAERPRGPLLDLSCCAADAVLVLGRWLELRELDRVQHARRVDAGRVGVASGASVRCLQCRVHGPTRTRHRRPRSGIRDRSNLDHGRSGGGVVVGPSHVDAVDARAGEVDLLRAGSLSVARV